MNRVQITFKSGAQIEFDCDELTTGRSQITNKLSSMNWNTPAEWADKLHLVELDEVVAIVAMKRHRPGIPG